MKVAKTILAFSVVWSGFVLAEPYAEWGVLSGGMPLEELDPEMKVPDVSEVPIPPPPGATFISGGGDKYCTIGLRTKQSVEEVCNYYQTKLKGYKQVDAPGLNSEGCQIFKDGDMETNLGVMVEEDRDPMFVENGSTWVAVVYYIKNGESCRN